MRPVSRQSRILLAIGLALAAFATATEIRTWLTVDACLDGGGAWDHAANACREP